MSGCGYVRPLTHKQECIRQYEIAKRVILNLREQGKLNDIPVCCINAIQIELYKNLPMGIVCQVNAEGKILYGYGLRFYGEKSELEKRLKL